MKKNPFFVIVRTINDNDEVEAFRTINFNNNKMRVWLSNHMLWAFNHCKLVEICKLGDFTFENALNEEISK